jgi:hypothetical protein
MAIHYLPGEKVAEKQILRFAQDDNMAATVTIHREPQR